MKPQVICHMLSSVDGRLHVGRYTPLTSGKTSTEASAPYYEYSAKFDADAQIIGGRTARESALPLRYEGDVATRPAHFQTFVGHRQSKRSLIVLDPQGTIRYDSDNVSGENLIAVLGESVSQQYLDHLQAPGVSYLFAGPKGDDVPRLLGTLSADFGMTRVLVEGGGTINGAFLKAGVIDELSLMLYPGIDGLAGIPSIFECQGAPGEKPAEGQSMELVAVETLPDGIVWLRYRFHRQ